VKCEDGPDEDRDPSGRAAQAAQEPPRLEGGNGLFDSSAAVVRPAAPERNGRAATEGG